MEGASVQLAPGHALLSLAIVAGCCTNSHAAASMLAGSSPWKALMGSCLQQRCATSQVARNLDVQSLLQMTLTCWSAQILWAPPLHGLT